MKILDKIDYDKLIENSLKIVVKESLKIFQEQGVVGEHHFFITFKTTKSSVDLPAFLLTQYPEEMTIILQHQFENLYVDDNSFSVDLSFGGDKHTLTIGFDAITYFADPFAKFGLSFESLKTQKSSEEEAPQKPVADVVSIDAFKKAKK